MGENFSPAMDKQLKLWYKFIEWNQIRTKILDPYGNTWTCNPKHAIQTKKMCERRDFSKVQQKLVAIERFCIPNRSSDDLPPSVSWNLTLLKSIDITLMLGLYTHHTSSCWKGILANSYYYSACMKCSFAMNRSRICRSTKMSFL